MDHFTEWSGSRLLSDEQRQGLYIKLLNALVFLLLSQLGKNKTMQQHLATLSLTLHLCLKTIKAFVFLNIINIPSSTILNTNKLSFDFVEVVKLRTDNENQYCIYFTPSPLISIFFSPSKTKLSSMASKFLDFFSISSSGGSLHLLEQIFRRLRDAVK